MATLTVWKFSDPDGATKAVDILEGLQKEQLITVQDAATVSWVEDAKRPKTNQLASLTGAGAMGGAERRAHPHQPLGRRGSPPA
jgi:uncharacterized membrane protein